MTSAVGADLPLAGLLAAVRPPPEIAASFLDRGWWRSETVLHDLYRAGAAHPDRIAIVAHRAHHRGTAQTLRISYAQLVTHVDRFAHALVSLGLGPGDPVAFQLPNWWEASALFFACLRIGAVAVPIMPSYGARDLEAVLTAAQPRLCVVPEVWGGAPQAEILASLAPTLPWLRRRIVVGDAAATGALDFTDYFVRTPHERYDRAGWLRVPRDLADRVCLAVSTMGLGDTQSMFMHTPNSLFAGIRMSADPDSSGTPAADVTYSALPFASLPSLLQAVVGPVVRGGTAVLQDVWDPETALDLLAQTGTSQAYATPVQWSELLSAQQRQPRDLGGLRRALSADPPGTSTRLARQVHDTLHVPLHVARGSAEAGGGTTASGQETELTPVDGEDGLFRLRVRGPSSCLAVWRRDTGQLQLAWEHQEGWFSTGDLVSVGAQGEVRVVQQQGEEVGGLFLIPVAEIEDGLLEHPRVAEAAVVACPDIEYGELACAVVVPAGDPPDLTDLREHLLRLGVARAHLPARLELVGALPRDELGDVRRGQLRERLIRRWSRRP